eukprot:11118489-Alexandrium_andersonii.AAC.1
MGDRGGPQLRNRRAASSDSQSAHPQSAHSLATGAREASSGVRAWNCTGPSEARRQTWGARPSQRGLRQLGLSGQQQMGHQRFLR